MSLGKGVSVYSVSADDLFAFNSSTKVPNIVKPEEVRIYPVTVDGIGRTFVEVRKFDGKWKFASFGEEDVARNLARFEQAEDNGFDFTLLGLSPDKRTKCVAVPAMNLYFVESSKASDRLRPLNGESTIKSSPAFQEGAFSQKYPNFAAQNGEDAGSRDVLLALSVELKDTTPLSPAPNPPPKKETAKKPVGAKCARGVSGSTPVPEAERADEATALRHKVIRGESLAVIAQHYYGKQTWRRIYEANVNSRMKCGPDLIFPNQELLIPRPIKVPRASLSVNSVPGVVPHASLRIDPGPIVPRTVVNYCRTAIQARYQVELCMESVREVEEELLNKPVTSSHWSY